MEVWFELLGIEKTNDIAKIKEAYQCCIKEGKYLSKEEYDAIYENILLYLNYQDVLDQYIYEMEHYTTYERVHHIIKSSKFQLYKNNQEFQKIFAVILKTKGTPNKVVQFLLKEFPLKTSTLHPNLHEALYELDCRNYSIQFIDKLIIIIGIAGIVLHLFWHLQLMSILCAVITMLYCLFLYLYIRGKRSINTRALLRNFTILILGIIIGLNYVQVGNKLGKESFEIEIVNKELMNSDGEAKIMNDQLFIYDDERSLYNVFDEKLKKISTISMETDYSQFDDIFVDNDEYYYTLFIDDSFIIKKSKDSQIKEIYCEKYEDYDYGYYRSYFLVDDHDLYLVFIQNSGFKVYQIQDDKCIFINEYNELDVNRDNIIIKSKYLFFSPSNSKTVSIYDLETGETNAILSANSEYTVIDKFQINDKYIIASTRNELFVYSFLDNTDISISNVFVEDFVFYDDHRILFLDDEKLSLYDIENEEYENSVELDYTDFAKQCIKFNQYIIIKGWKEYSVIKLNFKE